MEYQRLYFPVPESLPTQSLSEQLHGALPLAGGRAEPVRYGFYDSFDWRLHPGGDTLRIEHLDDAEQLQWEPADAAPLVLSLKQVPRFVWELPSPMLRERLAPLLEMRALLPQAELEGSRVALRQLNTDRKTVARLDIEELELLHEGERLALGRWLVLSPVRGYPDEAQAALKLLRGLGLRPDGSGIYAAALARQGLRPGGYSSKINITLHPDEPAAAATLRILHQLFDTMLANEAGTRADLDSEFLHDFRVAVRRTRSALSQVKGVLPQAVVDHFKQEFAWLGTVTGPTRDMDVYLLTFDHYKQSLPAEVQSDIDPLHDYLRNHQRTEQVRLVAELDSERYPLLLADWRKLLESPAASEAPNAELPIGELASKRIWKMYRRVMVEGEAIHDETPAEALHELRKSCKKLRYLMEFFASLYPKAEIKALIKALKSLQENLGDFQDYEVQLHAIRGFADDMLANGDAGADTLMAMGMLVEGLGQRQHGAREEFASRFAAFSVAETQALFRRLFKSPAATAEPIPAEREQS